MHFFLPSSSIQEFDISSNELSGRLPSVYSLGPALDALNFSHNQFDLKPVSVSPWEHSLPSTSVLDLSHNGIPYAALLWILESNSNSFSTIDLSGNPFSSIPSFQRGGPLTKLVLKNNSIMSIYDGAICFWRSAVSFKCERRHNLVLSQQLFEQFLRGTHPQRQSSALWSDSRLYLESRFLTDSGHNQDRPLSAG